MIKAEDLRIGDLVKYGKDIITIQATHADGLVCFADGKDQICVEHVLLEPIPLTPEILEKNGWSKRHDGSSSCDIYSKGKGSFHVRLEQCIYKKQEGFDFAVGDSTYRFGNKIEHVHELQHILWALGEDANLKI